MIAKNDLTSFFKIPNQLLGIVLYFTIHNDTNLTVYESNLKGLVKRRAMAKTVKYWSSMKLRKISGTRINVDKNSNIGAATCLVRAIFESLKSTSPIMLCIVFFISKLQAVKATIQVLEHSKM